ncbi:MAG TPA: RNA methyltransferase [Rubrobacteraceae bacterium]|nr:RNA methyltransferase [Rubrobacteraceae bacterium]
MISAKRAARLNQKKRRETEKLFLAEGASFLEESPEPPVALFETTEEVRRISSFTTPAGPVGVFPFVDVEPERLLQSCERVILLHGVQDPGNVGTIIRAAHAFGAGVALSIGCADLYNPKTVRATMGSIFHAPVARDLDSLDFIRMADAAEFVRVAAVVETGGAALDRLAGKVLIVVGAEGKGLPEEIISACDRGVTIPSRAASLNAAMAASILLYEAYRRVLP